MKRLAKPILALALMASMTAITVDSAEARGGRRFGGGIAAGLVAGALIGSYAYRPYYYSSPACYRGPLRCRWEHGYERCWRPLICD